MESGFSEKELDRVRKDYMKRIYIYIVNLAIPMYETVWPENGETQTVTLTHRHTCICTCIHMCWCVFHNTHQ